MLVRSRVRVVTCLNVLAGYSSINTDPLIIAAVITLSAYLLQHVISLAAVAQLGRMRDWIF